MRSPALAALLLAAVSLSACGGPSQPPEETADLQLTLSGALPAEVQRAYLVVHHADGSPDRWFDLKALAGEEQPLPRVAKYGYFTVLTQVEADLEAPRPGRYTLRFAASFPTEVFLSLDKGLRIDPGGRIYLAFADAASPWKDFDLAGACPDAADRVSNRSFGSAVDTGWRGCAGGAIDPGPLRAREQRNGKLSSFVWALAETAGAFGPTDPPGYAPVLDAEPGATHLLEAADWLSDVAVWRLDVAGAPADGRLLAAFAALRDGVEVAGFHVFSGGCPDAGATCSLAAVPGTRTGLEGYRLNARLDGANAADAWLTQAWKPLANDSGSYAWTYGTDLPQPYANVAWSGSPPVVEASGGAAAEREVADVWSYDLQVDPYLRREWWTFGRTPGEPIAFPSLPDAFADFVPNPGGDGAAVQVSGFDFDPLAGANPPEAGGYWVRARQIQALGTARLEARPATLRGPEGWTRTGGTGLRLR